MIRAGRKIDKSFDLLPARIKTATVVNIGAIVIARVEIRKIDPSGFKLSSITFVLDY